MPPAERARRLSRSLRTRFRIDLFSVQVEREFERCLCEAILAAERAAFQRGQEAALGGRPPMPLTPPLPTPNAGEAGPTTA